MRPVRHPWTGTVAVRGPIEPRWRALVLLVPFGGLVCSWRGPDAPGRATSRHTRGIDAAMRTEVVSAAVVPVDLSVEALYRRHVPFGTRLAAALIGDVHAAEDVAHEAFLRVASRRRTLARPELGRPGGECGASWNRTSGLTLIRAHRCRGIGPGQRASAAVADDPVPRPSRDEPMMGASGLD